MYCVIQQRVNVQNPKNPVKSTVSGNANYSAKISFANSYTYDTEKSNAGYTPSETGIV